MSKDRIALVTGASRGIGAAIAVGLAKRGYDLALNDIEQTAGDLKKVAGDIRQLGQRAKIYWADVSAKAQVDQMALDMLNDFGHVDVIVNNAGILISGEVDGLPEESWDAVMDINAKGSFLVIQALLASMKERKYGRIVNIASIGGKHGAPEQAHYSASKAAIMGFSRVLAQEVGQQGITVNCVCPGIIMTDMGRVNLEDPTISEAWKSKTAIGRIGEPEDVIGPVVFFASDDSAFVTGQTLNVDGGIVFS
jgi:3-oxoacyl-[acyl-carrier protein] reductase